MKTAVGEELVSTTQLAKLLNVTAATVRKWVHAGSIPCVSIGPKIKRFSVAEVMTALKTRHQPTDNANAVSMNTKRRN